MNKFRQKMGFIFFGLAAALIGVLASCEGVSNGSVPTLVPIATPTLPIYMKVTVGQETIATLSSTLLLPMPTTPVPPCSRAPEDWVEYKIRTGDRLVYLAPRYGLNSFQLAYYNCIPNPDEIFAGQVIYVPSNAEDPTLRDLPAYTVNAHANQKGNTQLDDNIFENNLVVITCRYPAVDQTASSEHCPRPPVTMLTVAQQYSNGWIFYFPSLNQFYVQLTDGTLMPPFDESKLEVDPYKTVSPEETIEHFVEVEQLSEQLGTPVAHPMAYSSTVQWTADLQGFTISLPYWPLHPVTTALAN